MKATPYTCLGTSLRATLCASAAFLAASLFAQTDGTPASAATSSTTSSSTASTSLKRADRRFIENAAKSGEAEVEIGNIILQRSSNADVKKFAQMMVDDHTRANEQLTSLASARGVKLPKQPKENRWEKRDPKDLDRDYMKKMVSDHKDDIKLFTKESESGGDPELVEFARKTLPTLQHHLEEADRINNTLK